MDAQLVHHIKHCVGSRLYWDRRLVPVYFLKCPVPKQPGYHRLGIRHGLIGYHRAGHSMLSAKREQLRNPIISAGFIHVMGGILAAVVRQHLFKLLGGMGLLFQHSLNEGANPLPQK